MDSELGLRDRFVNLRDGSFDLMEAFRARFPDRVRVLRNAQPQGPLPLRRVAAWPAASTLP